MPEIIIIHSVFTVFQAKKNFRSEAWVNAKFFRLRCRKNLRRTPSAPTSVQMIHSLWIYIREERSESWQRIQQQQHMNGLRKLRGRSLQS
jgi:hypothetical protein